ncbi:Protein BONZAI 3 [Diplonema papillatum]|nr:Protein BONZAI 3 [Diplonema papillatum]
MGGCCSSSQQEAFNDNDEQIADVEEMLRELGAADEAASSTVQLVIACRNIVQSGIRKFDPMVYVFEEQSGEKKFLGKTESIPAATHPQFMQSVTVVYQFAQVQSLLFELLSEERKGMGRDDQRLLGTMQVNLSKLLEDEAPYVGTLQAMPVTGAKAGDIIIKAEVQGKSEGTEYEVLFSFGCVNLESKNFFGAAGSDPFLVISRVVDGSFQPVAKTEYIGNVTACEWKPLVVRLERLCRGDFNAVVLIDVWDWEASGRHQMIGSVRTTLAQLLAHGSSRYKETIFQMDLVNVAKRGKENYLSSGTLLLNSIEVETAHSFLEYVKGGFEINLTICVDFSSSNGKPTDVTSLHYSDPNRRLDNEYVKALKAVVKVLGEYDKDQAFPFYGYGARERTSMDPAASDIFPVTFDPHRVEVHGIEGIVDAYWKCLDRIEMAEPTRFKNCMDKAYHMASGKKESYQIVLFVTDGQISDLQAMVDVVVECATEPISVIIIGVGDGPFADMEYLDGDDRPLVSSDGKMPNRDLVGFVPFREFQDDPEQLARETLKEIPKQFTKWAKLYKVKPPSRAHAEDNLDGTMRKEPVAEMPDLEARRQDHRMPQKSGLELAQAMGQQEVRVELRKDAGEGLGLVLRNLTIVEVNPGSAASRCKLHHYEGYALAQINGSPIRSQADIPSLVRDETACILTLKLDPNYEFKQQDVGSADDRRASENGEQKGDAKERRHRDHGSPRRRRRRDEDEEDGQKQRSGHSRPRRHEHHHRHRKPRGHEDTKSPRPSLASPMSQDSPSYSNASISRRDDDLGRDVELRGDYRSLR